MSDRIHEHIEQGDLNDAWWGLCRAGRKVSVRNLCLRLDVSRDAMRFALHREGYLALVPSWNAPVNP